MRFRGDLLVCRHRRLHRAYGGARGRGGRGARRRLCTGRSEAATAGRRRVRQGGRRRAHAPNTRSRRRDSPRSVDHAECDERTSGAVGSRRRPLRLSGRAQRRLLRYDDQHRRPRFRPSLEAASSLLQVPQPRSPPTSTECSTNRAGGKPCATLLSPWRFSPSFVWTRTSITWSWIRSARCRSTQNEPSVVWCSKGVPITSARSAAWLPSPRTDSGTPKRPPHHPPGSSSRKKAPQGAFLVGAGA